MLPTDMSWRVSFGFKVGTTWWIAAHTLVVAAPEDPGVPPELSKLLATEIPDADLHWLSPARHLATLEYVDRFNDLLRSHLNHGRDT